MEEKNKMECNICKKEQEMDVKNVVKLILCDGCLEKSEPSDVFIERVGNMTKHGKEAIRAVCGIDEEYNAYVNKYRQDTESEGFHLSDEQFQKEVDYAKQEKNEQGCGKYFKLGKITKLFTCGKVTEDNPYKILCDECKIEAHTKVSIDSYDLGVKHGAYFGEDILQSKGEKDG